MSEDLTSPRPALGLGQFAVPQMMAVSLEAALAMWARIGVAPHETCDSCGSGWNGGPVILLRDFGTICAECHLGPGRDEDV